MKIVIATPILFNSNSPFNHLFKDIIQSLCLKNEITRIVAVDNYEDSSFKMNIDGNSHINYILVKRRKTKKTNIFSRYIVDHITSIKMSKILSKVGGDVLFEDVSYSSHILVRAAKRKNMRVVSMLQDVWPDNAVQSQIIKSKSILYNLFEKKQKKVYMLSDKIICISDDMKEFILSKGVSNNKLEVIYNWGYSDEACHINWEENNFVKKYNFDNSFFYAVYAGNIGRMQNIELIIDAAKQLDGFKKIKFLIIGEGAMLSAIKEKCQDSSNIILLPFQPSELATSIYSMADVNLITLVPGAIKTALPSKTGVVLSCGKPIIMTIESNSKFASIIKNFRAGAISNPYDPCDLARKIVELYNNKMPRENFACFFALFRRTINLAKYKRIIENSIIEDEDSRN